MAKSLSSREIIRMLENVGGVKFARPEATITSGTRSGREP
jgi:hypothetical protein